MPTYDYQCQKCGHVFEAFQSILAKPLKKCPECAGKVERLIGGGSAVIFKGSGFYQTDYKASSSRSESSSSSNSCPSGACSGSPSSGSCATKN